MILETFLAACVTVVVNLSPSPWNDFDQETLERAKVRCGELYPDAPCLKKFIKKTKLDYAAICGKS